MADPKHISFHVGIGTYDSIIYPTASPLTSPPDDAGMAALAATLGYTATPTLIDGAATYEAVVGLFRNAVAHLIDGGGTCLITFSGHGTEFDNGQADPKQAVCLADATMSNDVVAGLSPEFPEDATVLIVRDCCHAASKGVTALTEFAISGERIRLGRPKVNGKPTKEPPKVAKELEQQFADFDRSKIKAKIAAFQACRHDQVTFDGAGSGKLGVYTQKFIDAVNGGAKTIGDVKGVIPKLDPQIPNCDPQFADLPDDNSVLGEPIHFEEPAVGSSSPITVPLA